MDTDLLFYGDNLDVLRKYIPDESVDLVYLDPPFNSKQDYNILFKENGGVKSAAQIKAFDDTWHWDYAAAEAFDEIVQRGGRTSKAMQAFQQLLGENDMLAYLSMMAPRLIELRRILKPTGSIYLHCDPTASHYLKMLMDGVFGPQSFRNEIIWKRTSGRKGISQFGRVHDTLLFYTASNEAIWNPPTVPQTATGHDIMTDESGRAYRSSDLSGKGQGPPRVFNGMEIPPPAGRHWMFDQAGIDHRMKEGRIIFSAKGTPRLKKYLDELRGIAVHDVWTDIDPINSAAQERLGYPTQKPESLLERIVKASSNEGDVILDPFCGCGTAVASAHRLKRRWIGIDITHLATSLIKYRLEDSFGPVDYEVIGEPVTYQDAIALAKQDAYQFQYWALSLVRARPEKSKKGADRGIDGRIYFRDAVDDRISRGRANRHIRQIRPDTGQSYTRVERRTGAGESPDRCADHASSTEPQDARGSSHGRVLRLSLGQTSQAANPDRRGNPERTERNRLSERFGADVPTGAQAV